MKSTRPSTVCQLDRVGGFGHFLGLGQELEDALGGGGRLLEDVGDVGDLRDRLGEGAHVLDEGLDIADGDRPSDRQVAAQDADGHVAQVADEVHDRHHQAGQELRFPGRAVERVVELVELFDALCLAVEGLHHDVAAVHFLDVAVDVAQVILLLLEVLLRLADDQADDDQRERDDHQRHQGHLPADGEHHDQHADHGRHRGDDLRQALVEGLADRVHIVGDAREHLAVVGAVEVPAAACG